MKVNVKKEFIEVFKDRIEDDDEFEDVEEYVNYILAQVVDRLENEKQEEEQDFSEEDEKKVKERLKALGYLD